MSLPRKTTRNGTRGYAHLVEVDVPVARVWRALTDPGLIRIWSGQEAKIDPRKGGSYQLGDRNAGGREAHIDIFDVNRRLRLIYLNGVDWPPSDSAVVDDFILDVRKGAGTTSLRPGDANASPGSPGSSRWILTRSALSACVRISGAAILAPSCCAQMPAILPAGPAMPISIASCSMPPVRRLA